MKSRERMLDATIERQAGVIDSYKDEIAKLKAQRAGFEVLVRTIRDAINIHLEEEDNGAKQAEPETPSENAGTED